MSELTLQGVSMFCKVPPDMSELTLEGVSLFCKVPPDICLNWLYRVFRCFVRSLQTYVWIDSTGRFVVL